MWFYHNWYAYLHSFKICKRKEILQKKYIFKIFALPKDIRKI